MIDQSFRLLLRSSSAALALAMTITGSAALAQDATPQSADAEARENADIIVTGSRLGRTGYDAPTPVNVVGEQRMEDLGITNVADALNQIPSFRAMSTPAMNSFRVSGNIGARTLDLRGLSATRTLTLVDGRRFVPSADNGTVDINSIPSLLVQRAEVVTGGASAAYGADAVAGVVNLILDKDFSGIKADINGGISERADAKNFYASLAGGTDFAGGRGHVIAGIEYSKEWGMGACEVRKWCAKYTNYMPNPGYNTTTRTSTNGLPATLVLDNIRFLYNDNGILASATKPGPNGTVTLGQQVLNVGATSLPTALRNKMFDPNGNLVEYQIGNLLSGLFQQKEFDATQPYLLGLSPTTLMVPTWHVSSMAHMDYELTDTIKWWGEGMYAHVYGGPAVSTPPLDGPANIDINNPYISDATRATILAADPAITRLNVNHGAVALGPSNVSYTSIDTYRFATGFEGEFGAGWSWDVYYTYGRVNSKIDDRGNRLKQWNDAIQAVRVTAANVGTSGLPIGSIACLINVDTNTTNNDLGCIPINLFGTIQEAAAKRYIVPEWQTRTYRQHVVSANLRGTPFSTWAGEVNVAVGGEWRRDTAKGTADANTLAGNFINPQTTALPLTKTEVIEGYLEAGVPLLQDSPMGEALDVDGAVRFTHYDPFGDATTWKVGLVYTPISDITFRVTRSHDIRAPTAQESSPNATRIQLPLPDPFVGGNTNQFVVTGGNPDLELEKANTFTAGIVFRPSFVRRLNVSLDYYDIKVSGAIDALTGPATSTACKNQNLLCDKIIFNPNGSINTIFANFQNLSQLHAEGLELVADYGFDGLGGQFTVQLNANYVIDLKTIGGTGLVTEMDGWTGNNGSVTNIQGVPRYKIDAVIAYSIGDWTFTQQHRYVPKGILDPTKIAPGDAGYDVNNPNSANLNYVDSRYYLNLGAKVKIADTRFGGGFEVYANVNNVFDKDQPHTLRLIGNALHFDSVGRAYKVGVRATF